MSPLPDATWRDDAALKALAEALGAADGQVRVVGGAVRDTLLGLAVADLDLATVHAPEESSRRIKAAGFKAVPTGMAHGTVTAVLPNGPVEVTTLRRDVSTDGRHAQVAFTDDWREDAARRDFTMNALYADPLTGEIFDYFDGATDLDARLVRFIGDPLERIAEDHLRILRFFRFHARFGKGAPDAAALAACTARANDLMALSRERIAQELLKLLATADPAPTLAVMIAHGILTPVLPEIDDAGVARLAKLVPLEPAPDAVRRLAALLPADPKIAEAVGARLKLSNAQRKRLIAAADPTPAAAPQTEAYWRGIDSARDRLLLQDRAADATALDGWQAPRFPLSGGALIAKGLPQGSIVAATLAAIERRWVDAAFPDQLDAIVEDEVAKALKR